MTGQKYIGGEFFDDEALPWQTGAATGALQFEHYFPERANNCTRLLFETGSDAVAYFLLHLHRQQPELPLQLWLPDNFCFESINRSLLKTQPYGLECTIERYRNQSDVVRAPGIRPVLLHLHFNLYQPVSFSGLHSQGFTIIEDFAQAPLDIRFFTGDYAFNSMRKLGPYEVAVAYVPQGSSNTGIVDIQHTPSEYYKLKKLASEQKSTYINTLEPWLEESYLQLYKDAKEKLHDAHIYSAQAAEKELVQTVNYHSMLQCRKANYQFLKERFSCINQLNIQPGSYTYLVVKTTAQAALRRYCFSRGMFPAILWLDSETPESREILSFMIDQRYNLSDMKRVASTVETFFREHS